MARSITVSLLPSLQGGLLDLGTTCVVIDTLRFTTTACQALHAGAALIRISPGVEQAFHIAEQLQDAEGIRPLLCGERLCQPIPGFDLGNSPLEYVREKVGQRSLVFTTTNGTQAIAATLGAGQTLLGSLINRRALCEHLQRTTERVAILCAGTDGHIAYEDALAAGAICELLTANEPVFELSNDSALLALDFWREISRQTEQPELPTASLQDRILDRFKAASGGKNLVSTGYVEDLKFCAQLDALNVVPRSLPDTIQEYCDVFDRDR